MPTAFYNRLTGIDLDESAQRIPLDTWTSAMNEFLRARLTEAQVKSTFAISLAADVTAWESMRDRLTAALTPLLTVDMRDALILAESGIVYPTIADVQNRFGVPVV